MKKSHSQSFDLYLIFIFFLSLMLYWSLSLPFTFNLSHSLRSNGREKNVAVKCKHILRVFHSRSEYIMCDIWAWIWRRTIEQHTKFSQPTIIIMIWRDQCRKIEFQTHTHSHIFSMHTHTNTRTHTSKVKNSRRMASDNINQVWCWLCLYFDDEFVSSCVYAFLLCESKWLCGYCLMDGQANQTELELFECAIDMLHFRTSLTHSYTQTPHNKQINSRTHIDRTHCL